MYAVRMMRYNMIAYNVDDTLRSILKPMKEGKGKHDVDVDNTMRRSFRGYTSGIQWGKIQRFKHCLISRTTTFVFLTGALMRTF